MSLADWIMRVVCWLVGHNWVRTRVNGRPIEECFDCLAQRERPPKGAR